MDIQLLYWHWLVIGMLLVVAEIFIPSFTVLWFGLGALVVGFVENGCSHVDDHSNTSVDCVLSVVCRRLV